MMFLAWPSTHLTYSEWKGHMGAWKWEAGVGIKGPGGDQRSRWRLDGNWVRDIRHPATGSTSECRRPEPLWLKQGAKFYHISQVLQSRQATDFGLWLLVEQNQFSQGKRRGFYNIYANESPRYRAFKTKCPYIYSPWTDFCINIYEGFLVYFSQRLFSCPKRGNKR